MKRSRHGKKVSDDLSGANTLTLKDRRKAYYHGKYNREIFSIVLLLAFVGMFIIQ